MFANKFLTRRLSHLRTTTFCGKKSVENSQNTTRKLIWSHHTTSYRLFNSRKMAGKKEDALVLAVDQGTSSTRSILFNAKGEQLFSQQVEFESIYPQQGWVEQKGAEIMDTVWKTIEDVVKQCGTENVKKIVGVGITNQRETTILWDKHTGTPLHNALVWLDTRTAETCNDVLKRVSNDGNHFRKACGLPISTYFSAMKIKWLMDHVPEVKRACDEGRCLFGTVDSWLIWNMTGGTKGGIHMTDVTNASRTMLMNLQTLQWDESVCKFLGIPMNILPKIRSSSEVYGKIAQGPLQGVPLCGCLGDQQAAMLGQGCVNVGDAKNTYGTGCFMLFNTGKEPIQSTHGLLTTLGYKFGDKPAVYALEGSVAIAGAGVKWLRDNFGIIKNADDITQVKDTGGIYFVPAFSGLFAPYWRTDARGAIVGLTQYTNKYHLARAVLEAVCFQSREILDAMESDSKTHLKSLRVDGGMTKSSLLLQIQADLIGITVVRPEDAEKTALGAAFAAGLAVHVWESENSLPSMKTTQFEPKTNREERESRLKDWKKAVERTFNWV